MSDQTLLLMFLVSLFLIPVFVMWVSVPKPTYKKRTQLKRKCDHDFEYLIPGDKTGNTCFTWNALAAPERKWVSKCKKCGHIKTKVGYLPYEEVEFTQETAQNCYDDLFN